jgi:hypothetical protein
MHRLSWTRLIPDSLRYFECSFFPSERESEAANMIGRWSRSSSIVRKTKPTRRPAFASGENPVRRDGLPRSA